LSFRFELQQEKEEGTAIQPCPRSPLYIYRDTDSAIANPGSPSRQVRKLLIKTHMTGPDDVNHVHLNTNMNEIPRLDQASMTHFDTRCNTLTLQPQSSSLCTTFSTGYHIHNLHIGAKFLERSHTQAFTTQSFTNDATRPTRHILLLQNAAVYLALLWSLKPNILGV
jgi:hypothetical protein